MSTAAETIAGEIREKGVITFARFMELALYCPNCGYYEREEDNIGRGGDFYTSVSVSRLFGELLAFQFAGWLEEWQPGATMSPDAVSPGKTSAGETIRIAEAGAHDGTLARDILAWLQQRRPSLYQRLEYWIVEPSERRQHRQRQNLCEFGARVRWVNGLAGLDVGSTSGIGLARPAGWRGVFFSNELLDAMPVRRLGWDAKARAWFELGVTLEGGRLVWARISGAKAVVADPQVSAPSPIPHGRFPAESELLDFLPDGFTTEVSPAAERWWRGAAQALGQGRLLTIDYGLTAEESLVPERKQGTLRAYHRHRLSSEVLACPGEQDITAHVNFTAIQAAGEATGLRTEAFLTQAQFLTSIAARTWQREGSFGEWTPERRRQFQTLIHPEHLGRSFRVLVQAR